MFVKQKKRKKSSKVLRRSWSIWLQILLINFHNHTLHIVWIWCRGKKLYFFNNGNIWIKGLPTFIDKEITEKLFFSYSYVISSLVRSHFKIFIVADVFCLYFCVEAPEAHTSVCAGLGEKKSRVDTYQCWTWAYCKNSCNERMTMFLSIRLETRNITIVKNLYISPKLKFLSHFER